MKKKTTERGFQYIEFKDIYDWPCSIQKSSLATADTIWLGGEQVQFDKVTQTYLSPRMHIDQKLAKKLIKVLQKFVDTGDL